MSANEALQTILVEVEGVDPVLSRRPVSEIGDFECVAVLRQAGETPGRHRAKASSR